MPSACSMHVLIMCRDDHHAEITMHLIRSDNDEVYDLLRDPKRTSSLEVHEDATHGIYVQNLSQYSVASARDAMSLLRCGDDNRTVRQTVMNQN